MLKDYLRKFVPGTVLAIKRFLWGPQARLRRLEAAHRRRNLRLGDAEICIRDGVILKLHADSREAFEAFCFRFPNMVSELDRFLVLAAGKRCLLDVGALHGIFSLMFLATGPDREALAVDASPIAFQRLQWNIRVNGMSSMKAVECALSNEAGILKMHYEWEHAVAAGTTNPTQCLMVPSRTGDTLCQDLGVAPDIIKIDVEGHEVKVLSGLKSTIMSLRPLIFLELHPQRLAEEGDSLESVLLLLDQLRYVATDISGRELDRQRLLCLSGDERLVLVPRR